MCEIVVAQHRHHFLYRESVLDRHQAFALLMIRRMHADCDMHVGLLHKPFQIAEFAD